MRPTTQTKLDLIFLLLAILSFVIYIYWITCRRRLQDLSQLQLIIEFIALQLIIWIIVCRHLLKTISLKLWKFFLNSYVGYQNRQISVYELQTWYQPLDQESREIRLLKILPGRGSEAIECTLHCRVSLNNRDLEEFEALSYHWGGPLHSRKILVDGKPFIVRSNIYTALQRLRQGDCERLIWIDVVCINQHDMVEKSAQVRLMRDIYRSASKVIVWLGPDTATSGLACNFMKWAINETGNFLSESIGDPQYLKEWTAIRELFKRQYWSRVWIIQEVAMAGEVEVWCGQSISAWQTLVTCDTTWYTQKRAKLLTHSSWFGKIEKNLDIFNQTTGPSLLNLTRSQVSGRQKSRAVDTIQQAAHSSTLLDLIHTYWMSECSDPRDQIYALLGISSDQEQLGIEMNYELDLRQVYYKFMVSLVGLTKKLDILGLAGISHRDQYKSWISKEVSLGASYLPTFSSSVLSKSHLGRINLNEKYTASGNLDAVVEFHYDRITVNCFDIGRIARLGPKAKYDSGSLRDGDLRRVVQDIRKCHVFASRIVEEYSQQHYYDEDPSFGNIFQRALQRDLDELWRILICNRTIEGTLPPESWAEQYSAIIRDEPSSSLIESNRSYLEAVLHIFSSNRRLFATRCGRFGIGPTDASLKNRIILLRGCNVPMLVHEGYTPPTRQSRLSYRWPELDYLKSWVYLHGFMEGEAIRESLRGEEGKTKSMKGENNIENFDKNSFNIGMNDYRDVVEESDEEMDEEFDEAELGEAEFNEDVDGESYQEAFQEAFLTSMKEVKLTFFR